MSVLDIATSLFRVLNVTSVNNTIDGGIYKFNRPINSRKKDIIITVPEYNGGQFNTGFIDINIHVPNLQLVNDQTNPDLAAMKTIVDAMIPLLFGMSGYALFVSKSGIPNRDADGQWYCNIRVAFTGIDENSGKEIKLIALNNNGDGYGGYTATRLDVWSGKGAMMEVKKGSQLSVNAGRYEFNMSVDWLLPKESKPEKYMVLVTDEGEYTIKGIIPDSGMWRISTVRKDGKINS
ncbi:MAG: hypothetical protein LBF27_25830 [Sphingobacterium sp.]|jgi:hypothetical protein|nr:hypothetical protein [Sphingobacterium sp.]